jgi:CRISPR/Cas system-associated endonuclease Cas1
MGIEGSIAKNYFAQWRRLWGKAWHFQERNRRLPRDPVNAWLSLRQARHQYRTVWL